MNDDLRDESTDIIPKKAAIILEQLEEVKKKKKITVMLSNSVRAEKQLKRFVKLQRSKVSTLQIQQKFLATPL